MKGLHPVAALAIIILTALFLYIELQQAMNSNVVASVTKKHSHRREGE